MQGMSRGLNILLFPASRCWRLFMLHDRGVFIVFGTDTGGSFTYHRELELYQCAANVQFGVRFHPLVLFRPARLQDLRLHV
jgi:hypothetical protein